MNNDKKRGKGKRIHTLIANKELKHSIVTLAKAVEEEGIDKL